MGEQKVYFSHCSDPNHWPDEGCGVLTVFLVPKRWWSIGEWRFAFSLRGRFLKHMAEMMNTNHQILRTQEGEDEHLI